MQAEAHHAAEKGVDIAARGQQAAVAHQQPAAAAAGQGCQGLGRLARQPEAALADGRGHRAIDKSQVDKHGMVEQPGAGTLQQVLTLGARPEDAGLGIPAQQLGQVGAAEGKAPKHLPGFCSHQQQADGQQRHGGGGAIGRIALPRLPGPGGLAGPTAQKKNDQGDEQQLQQQGAGQPEEVEAYGRIQAGLGQACQQRAMQRANKGADHQARQGGQHAGATAGGRRQAAAAAGPGPLHADAKQKRPGQERQRDGGVQQLGPQAGERLQGQHQGHGDHQQRHQQQLGVGRTGITLHQQPPVAGSKSKAAAHQHMTEAAAQPPYHGRLRLLDRQRGPNCQGQDHG